MKAKSVKSLKDISIKERQELQDRLNDLLLFMERLEMTVNIVEDYKGHKDFTVMRIIRYGHPVEIINISGNSNEAIFREFCRYIADKELCGGYSGEEK